MSHLDQDAMKRTPDQERFQGDLGGLEWLLDDERENHTAIAEGLAACEKAAEVIRGMPSDAQTAADLDIIAQFQAMTERRKDYAWGRIRSVKADRNHAMGVPSLEEAMAQAQAGAGGPLAGLANTDLFSSMADVSGATGPMPWMDVAPKAKKKNKKKNKKKVPKFQVKVDGKDEVGGKYCLVSTTKRGTVKYYIDVPSVTSKIHRKLAFPQDFPRWCMMFSDFCAESRLDNVILDRELTADEQEVLRAGMELTLKQMFDIRVDFSLKAGDLWAELKRKARGYFTPERRARLWHALVVDRSCCDTISLEAELKEMVMMERCTAQSALQYQHTNSLIKSSVTQELWQLYTESTHESRSLDSVPPEHLVTDLVMLLGSINEKEGRSPRTAMQCPGCGSFFHEYASCRVAL